ncbi:MAG: WD40 repeat domain-containing protein [Isosphaeraceae bacterium]
MPISKPVVLSTALQRIALGVLTLAIIVVVAVLRWGQGELRRFEGHTGRVDSVALSADGRRALSGCMDDGTVRLWDTETGQELKRWDTDGLYKVALSADGRRALCALSGTRDCPMRLWDTETGQELKRYWRKWHNMSSVDSVEFSVNSVALSADGRRALSGSDDWTMRPWNTETGQELKRFKGHTGSVTVVALSADGSRGLSGSGDDWTMRLWDTGTGQELKCFVGHTDGVSGVALSADGRRALSGSLDGTMLFWAVPK